jgi:hypothetical protein
MRRRLRPDKEEVFDNPDIATEKSKREQNYKDFDKGK